MKINRNAGMILAGSAAGIINGLFGAGGGMVLIPLLRRLTGLDDHKIFSVSVAVILPICAVSLWAASGDSTLPWREALPYLIGSGGGGWLAARYGSKIPVKWLHRSLGLLILWGGVRYLC